METTNSILKTQRPVMPDYWDWAEFEYGMADKFVANAATIRFASRECARIEKKMISMAAARRDDEWRLWDGRRGGCANDLVILIHVMRDYGYDTDPVRLGEFLMEKYRDMLRWERKGETSKYGIVVYVPDGWLKDLKLPEYIELAPRIWKDYLGQFKAA